MAVTIGPELEARLREKAASEGRTLDELVESLLISALAWERMDREQSIVGIQRGLNASAAGRVRPAAEIFAEMRGRLEDPRE